MQHQEKTVDRTLKFSNGDHEQETNTVAGE